MSSFPTGSGALRAIIRDKSTKLKIQRFWRLQLNEVLLRFAPDRFFGDGGRCSEGALIGEKGKQCARTEDGGIETSAVQKKRRALDAARILRHYAKSISLSWNMIRAGVVCKSNISEVRVTVRNFRRAEVNIVRSGFRYSHLQKLSIPLNRLMILNNLRLDGRNYFAEVTLGTAHLY